MSVVIKDRAKFYNTITGLKPAASKVFLHFILFQEKGRSFQKTFWDISNETGVKNPFLAINELVEKGLVKKESTKLYGGIQFTVMVDLIGF